MAALRQLVVHFYENRTPVAAEVKSEMPIGVSALLKRYSRRPSVLA